MTPEPLPEDIRRFILTRVPSVPWLEALLLMRREASTDWTPATLARRLYLGEREASEILLQLHAADLVSGDPAAGPSRYAPRDDALATLIGAVADAYARDLIGVTRLIHSRLDRTAQQFADAFKFRRDR